jgi:threonine dehydrogenase-like Zn-dependent dehydrogenase
VKVLTIVPGTPGVQLGSRPEPKIQLSDDVLLDVLQVGICGTDRDEASGGRAEPPPGAREIVIGHEMVGRVAAIGPDVATLIPGDYAVLTVRRGCTGCLACVGGRPDMCYSGDYTERGIKGEDGYQAERVVEREQYAVSIPASLAEVGALIEPLSVGEKAIEEAFLLQQARFGDLRPAVPLAVVAGLGPVGLLAAMALRLRGVQVIGLDVMDPTSDRARVITDLGCEYVDGRAAHSEDLRQRFGRIDLVFEATGVPALEFDLVGALGLNGIYVLTGIAAGSRPVTVDGATLMRGLVLGNRLMVGSVNASRHHFEAAVADLERGETRWPGLAARLITHRLAPEAFARAFARDHAQEEIKTVIQWQPSGRTAR